MGDGGKGSSPRPIEISQSDFAARWDQIFSNKCSQCNKIFRDKSDIHTCTLTEIKDGTTKDSTHNSDPA